MDNRETFLDNLIAELQRDGLFPTDPEKFDEEIARLGEVSVKKLKNTGTNRKETP